MKKILITGGEGRLSKEILPMLSDFKVYAPCKKKLDITNINNIKEISSNFNPDYIIHTAAFTDVDKCEQYPDKSFYINTYGTLNLIECFKNKRFIFLSTDYVFDGSLKRPYNEFDIPNPVSIYGITKLSSENFIRERCQNYLIIRTSWLLNAKNDFISKIISLYKSQDRLKIVSDQIGSPTIIKDLAKAIVDLLNIDYCGILNITNSGKTSWYNLALKTFELLKLDKKKLIKTTINEFNSVAPRPKYSVLSNNLFSILTKKKLDNWENALNRILNH